MFFVPPQKFFSFSRYFSLFKILKFYDNMFQSSNNFWLFTVGSE